VFYVINKRLEEERQLTLKKKESFENILKQDGLDERKKTENEIRLRKSVNALKEIDEYNNLCGK
jgi:hypothetical protein